MNHAISNRTYDPYIKGMKFFTLKKFYGSNLDVLNLKNQKSSILIANFKEKKYTENILFLFNIVDVCLRDGTSGSHIKGNLTGDSRVGPTPYVRVQSTARTM